MTKCGLRHAKITLHKPLLYRPPRESCRTVTRQLILALLPLPLQRLQTPTNQSIPMTAVTTTDHNVPLMDIPAQVLRFIIHLRVRYNALSSVVTLCILHLSPVTAAVPECCPPRVTGAAHRKGETEQVFRPPWQLLLLLQRRRLCLADSSWCQCSAVLASLRTRRRINM
jgi:hypothetical protein